ncbi:DUF397 domain-containing protein [Streptomyces sp. MAR4 CNX-425]|uniref:DUF397 domain-containing protein n=1 Tax=Streptomyces sp. MAR4 CNX-425 TaxID=3406343 RepID=UPI003B501EBF
MTAKTSLYKIDLDGLAWRKSSFSETGENCVEVAELPGDARAVRDSKNPEREPLRFTAAEWAAFRAGVIAGEL